MTYSDATSGVDKVRYRNEGGSWTGWEDPDVTRAWDLTPGDGTKTVYYEIRDNAGLIFQDTDTIGLDTELPTGSIIINANDQWTTSTSVTLTLTYSDATSDVDKVRYRNEGGSWTGWEDPGVTRAWDLTPGEGTKTVYYEIRDNAGLIFQDTDTIGLDTTYPTGSIIINDGDAWTNSTIVSLTLTYSDATSDVDKVRYSNDGSSWTGWEDSSGTRGWVLNPGDGIKTVYYEIRDNAGLIFQATDTIGLDTEVPTILNVSSPEDNDTYGIGTIISITVTFSESVYVTGTPTLTLETGTVDTVIDYTSGSGTATLMFTYTVASGHNSSDLDYISTDALSLNGGTIKDAGENDALLTLPAPGTPGSLSDNKDIVIDTTIEQGPDFTLWMIIVGSAVGVGVIITAIILIRRKRK